MKDQMKIEDQILVMDAQTGDRKSMERLVNRYQKRLWAHAYRLTSSQQAAWDVTQAAWIGIIKSLGKLSDPERFRVWAYRIVTNKACDWIKKQQKSARHVPLETEIPMEEKKDDGVFELIDRLKPAFRNVLWLFYYQDLSIAEISIVLNIPRGTVKSRLSNARNSLKELLNRHNSK